MNVNDMVLKLLSEENDYISGETAANTIGVSRNAVWKAVKALEAEGHTIESLHSKGYRLAPDSIRLNEHLIASRLNTVRLGRHLVVLEEVDSTNDYAKKLAPTGAVHGTAVVADRQTAGKGRVGRSFDSPGGKGLYVSIIVRPDFKISDAGLITSMAACAVANAIEAVCPAEVGIKWVNDLYIGSKKVCGILTEATLNLEARELDHAVIGIGVNVLSAKAEFGADLSSRATSIEDETGERISRNVLCAEILNKLEEYMTNMKSRVFLDEYRRREILTGNMITTRVGDKEITGKAVGIDDNAGLVINTGQGTITLHSGEAQLSRIKKD